MTTTRKIGGNPAHNRGDHLSSDFVYDQPVHMVLEGILTQLKAIRISLEEITDTVIEDEDIER